MAKVTIVITDEDIAKGTFSVWSRTESNGQEMPDEGTAALHVLHVLKSFLYSIEAATGVPHECLHKAH